MFSRLFCGPAGAQLRATARALVTKRRAPTGLFPAWLAHQPARNIFQGAKADTWTVEHVRKWAVEVVGIKPKHADLLVAQEIGGTQLTKMTEDKLRSFGIPVGPAGELEDAIKALTLREIGAIAVPPISGIFATADFVTLRTSGGLYFDRTSFIPRLEALQVDAILANRPRRFGKSLFKSMLMAYYDVANQGQRFEALFGGLDIGSKPTPLVCSFLILALDFSSLSCNSMGELVDSLNGQLVAAISLFGEKYASQLGQLPHFESPDGIVRLAQLAGVIKQRGCKLFVFVDEYDVAVGLAFANPAMTKQLSVPESDQEVKLESVFKRFFSALKSILGPHRAFITGVTPLAMTQFTSGFNVAHDLAHRLEFTQVCGLSETEVTTALTVAAPLLDKSTVNAIIERWRQSDDGYFFHPDQSCGGLYNTTRVLYGCKEVAFLHARGLRTADELLSYPPDPNTKVADATLMMLARSSHGPSLFVDALHRSGQSRLRLSQEYPLPRFRLESLMGDFDADRSSILSFAWYLGGLTCVQGQKGFLRIPNNTARQEIIGEAKRFYDWLPGQTHSFRKAIHSVFAVPSNVQPLCDLVQQVLFKPLKDNQVKHNNEAAVLQAFLAAFVIPFEFGDAEPEFQVDPQQRTADAGLAIDIAYSKDGKRVALDFQNISAWNVFQLPDGRKRPSANFEDASWQKQTAWSQEIAALDKDAIWECRIYDMQEKKQITLRAVVDKKKEEVRKKYLEKLRHPAHAGKLHAVWVVCRIGLHRVVSSAVEL